MKNELLITVRGITDKNHRLSIDGDDMNISQNKFGSSEVKFATDKDEVEVAIFKYLELSSPLWLVMSIFFFIISIFGIFEPRYDRRCIVYDCKFKVKLCGRTNVALSPCDFDGSEGKAFKLESTAEIEEMSNVQYVDARAKRRWRITVIVKICIFAAAVAITATVLVTTLS